MNEKEIKIRLDRYERAYDLSFELDEKYISV